MPYRPHLRYFFIVIATFGINAFSAPPTGSLPFAVFDRARGSALFGVTLCLDGTELCIASDSTGKALLQACPVGVHTVTASATGYDTQIIPNTVINSGTNTTVRIELSRASEVQDLDKMTVSAKRIEAKRADQVASVTRLSSFDLQNTAGTANDVNRVLQTLPSVVTGGTNFDNSMVVRGGHTRENVFLLDGIELDNISHFSDIGSSGGSFGFIDGALLQSLDFYCGSMPASLPARMSSVIDMTMRDGSTTSRNYQLHLNTSGVGLTAEGPFPNKRGSYLISARYIDTRSVKDLVGIEGLPRFGDSQSKFTFPINSANSLSLTSVISYDNYQEAISTQEQGFASDYDYAVAQYATGLQWNTVQNRFKNRVLLSYYRRNELGSNKVRDFDTRFDVYNEWYYGDSLINGYRFPLGDTAVSNYRYSVTDKEFYRFGDDRSTVQFKDDFTFYLRDNDQIKLGGTVSRQRLTSVYSQAEEWAGTYYTLRESNDPASLDSASYSNKSYSTDSTVYDTAVGAYCNYIFTAGPVKAVAGVRGDYFRLLRDYGFSPRCAVSYEHPVAGTFALSGGLYYQQPSTLSRRIRDLITPNPNYASPMPPLYAIELQRSWQGVLSYEKQLAGLHLLTVETYGKWYDREYKLVQPDYYDYQRDFNEAISENRSWTLAKPHGKKKAYGLELSFQKKEQQGLYYAAGFSLSSVQNRYTDGKWYADAQNVRTHGSLLLGKEFLKRHSISSRIYLSEGRPYSKGYVDDEARYMVLDTTQAYLSGRLDPVVSVNLRYNFRFYPTFGTVTGYIEAWNLFNYQPVITRTLGWREYVEQKALGIIPFIGLTADF